MGDGWFDRLSSATDRARKAVAGGVVGVGTAAQAPFGLVKDVAVGLAAPLSGGRLDSSFNRDPFGELASRGGQVFGGLLGEGSGVEWAVGGLPEGVRSPVRTAGEGLETAYREGIGEPLSTVQTAAAIRDGGDRSLFDQSTWRDAYRIAQTRSPGQAAAFNLARVDITDTAEVEKFQKSTFYEVSSGTADAVFRLGVDPTVIGGKMQAVARLRYVTKPLKAGDDLDAITKSARVRKFVDAMEGKTADQIRNQFFPDSRFGAAQSTVLAAAPDAATRASILKGFMGDLSEIDKVGKVSADLAQQQRRIMGDIKSLAAVDGDWSVAAAADGTPSLLGAKPEWLDAEVERLNSELKTLYKESDMAAMRQSAMASISEQPRVTLGAKLRSPEVSHLYQTSPWAAPLRTVFKHKPHGFVNVEDRTSDIQLARHLEESPLTPQVQGEFRAQYMAAADPYTRAQILVEADDAAIRAFASQANMSVAEIQALMSAASAGRTTASQVLKNRAFDGEGRSLVQLRGDGPPTDIALLVSQQANVLPLTDFAELRRALRPVGRFKSRFPGARIPGELLSDAMKVWRPLVLLRGGWPVKVVGDEQARISAIVGPRQLAAAHRKNVVDRMHMGIRQKPAYNGYSIPAAFDDPIYKTRVGSKDSMDATLGRNEKGILPARKIASPWRNGITRAENPAEYGRNWENAVNRHLGNDPFSRKILEGADVHDIKKWLDTTPDGQAYARKMPERYRSLESVENWYHAVAGQIDAYLPSDELKQLALARKAKANDLLRTLGDGAYPPIHGEVIEQMLGSAAVTRAWRGTTEFMFKWLGQQPSDVLSRQVFFDLMYQQEFKRRLDLLAPQAKKNGVTLSADVQREVAAGSREYALGEVKHYLYDLAEGSRLASHARFVAPFANAWQEVASVWGDIAVTKNPAFVARAHLALTSGDKTGWSYTDDDGNTYIQVPLPDGVKNLPFVGGALKMQGVASLNTKSFNMLSAWPGTGPVVGIAAREVLKRRPELSDTAVADFIFPYGQPQGLSDFLLPAYGKRLKSTVKGEDDRAYLSAVQQIFITQQIDFSLGKRDKPADWVEAEQNAGKLMLLRAAVSWMSPAAITFGSPYHVEAEKLRALYKRFPDDPARAEALFIEEEGAAFFPLTTGFTKSMDGVPATVGGFEARKRYEDLIEAAPEFGSLIVGEEGAGEFARWVYEYQRDNNVSGQSSETQRRPRTKEEIAAAPELKQGWGGYMNLMRMLQVELDTRGLANMQQKEARDLADLKRAAIADIGERFPAWHKEFQVTDRGTWNRRIDAMSTISADPRMQRPDRPDMQGIRDYLQLRETFVAELRSRKAKTLSAASNQDLAELWEAAVADLVERNPAFEDTYNRWLTNDPVETG